MTNERVVSDAEDIALAVRDLTDEVRKVRKAVAVLGLIQLMDTDLAVPEVDKLEFLLVLDALSRN